MQPDTFPVKPTDPYVVGGLYPFDDTIAITDDQGNQVATLNTQNGEILLDNGAATSSTTSAGASNG